MAGEQKATEQLMGQHLGPLDGNLGEGSGAVEVCPSLVDEQEVAPEAEACGSRDLVGDQKEVVLHDGD